MTMASEMMCAYCGRWHPWTREFFPNRIEAVCAACAAVLYAPKTTAWQRIKARFGGEVGG